MTEYLKESKFYPGFVSGVASVGSQITALKNAYDLVFREVTQTTDQNRSEVLSMEIERIRQEVRKLLYKVFNDSMLVGPYINLILNDYFPYPPPRMPLLFP
jgi:hypothetical protein